MIKLFGLLHKRDDISQRQFHAHWRGPHAEHALKLVPVLQRYVQNHKAAKPYPNMNPPCDGSPEVWLEDIEASVELNTMPEYMTGAYIDEPNFMRVRSEGVVVSEQVVIAGPPIAKNAKLTKALFFLKRNPSLSAEQFREQWLAHDRPLFTRAAHAQRFVRSPTLAQTYVGGEATYDGVEELWWPSLAAWEKDRKGAINKNDLRLLLDLEGTTAMFVDENRVFWPGLVEEEAA